MTSPLTLELQALSNANKKRMTTGPAVRWARNKLFFNTISPFRNAPTDEIRIEAAPPGNRLFYLDAGVGDEGVWAGTGCPASRRAASSAAEPHQRGPRHQSSGR